MDALVLLTCILSRKLAGWMPKLHASVMDSITRAWNFECFVGNQSCMPRLWISITKAYNFDCPVGCESCMPRSWFSTTWACNFDCVVGYEVACLGYGFPLPGHAALISEACVVKGDLIICLTWVEWRVTSRASKSRSVVFVCLSDGVWSGRGACQSPLSGRVSQSVSQSVSQQIPQDCLEEKFMWGGLSPPPHNKLLQN